jgi:protease-4
MGAETMKRLLAEVAEDGSLDAVVLRIDSPGGDAIASEEIWGAVGELRRAVPVIVSMGDVAASGGYYMAAGADAIVASPSTLTGSIGVFGVLFNAGELYDKVGIDWDVLETNPAADFPTSTRPLSEEERATFRGLIEHTYRTFLGRVAEGRGMEEEQVDAVAQGRVWSGVDAAQRGLVDRVGGLEEALAVAREAAGLDPDAAVTLRVYPRPQSLLDRMRDAMYLRGIGATAAAPAAPTARERAALLALGDLVRGLSGLAVALRHDPGRAMTALPWVPEIH